MHYANYMYSAAYYYNMRIIIMIIDFITKGIIYEHIPRTVHIYIILNSGAQLDNRAGRPYTTVSYVMLSHLSQSQTIIIVRL